MKNLLLAADSYKHSHFQQYPPGTCYVSSYIEARGTANDGPCIFIGVQAFLHDYLSRPVTQRDIEEAAEVLALHGVPFNREGWEYILKEHKGYLPLEIQSLEEGTLVPRGVPLVQVRNTDPKLPWLTSFIETALLRSIWYPTTVATTSFVAKIVIYDGLRRSSDDPEAQIPFKLHDFGARGVSSSESAAIGGMAHLVNFSGTDTLEALIKVRDVYSDPDAVVGFSIPASEHSTMTAWGTKGESKAYENMIDQFGNGLFSVVADSYNLFDAVNEIFGTELKDKIENINGCLVIRPDSGDPVTTPIAVLDALWNKFGGTINSKGFKVLNSKVRVIQGDGMDSDSIMNLVRSLLFHNWSLDNIAFGMGGGLLQKHSRDDFRFAMKANAIADELGNWTDLQKKPATDPGKTSKAGRQAVIKIDGTLKSVREESVDATKNLLKSVYGDGVFVYTDFQSVRDRAHAEMKHLLEQLLSHVAYKDATSAA